MGKKTMRGRGMALHQGPNARQKKNQAVVSMGSFGQLYGMDN
jgi:hypothetical protein